MANELAGRTAAFLVANEGIEQVELTDPWNTVEEAGGRAVLIAPEPGSAQAFHHLDKAGEFSVDATTADADSGDFDFLVLPGGVANPDALRLDANAVTFIREFVHVGRPVAAICHAPWTLVEADVVESEAGRPEGVLPGDRRPVQRLMSESSDLPLPGYDQLPLGTLAHRVRTLNAAEVRTLVVYESEHADRLAFLELLHTRLDELGIGATSSDGSPDAP